MWGGWVGEPECEILANLCKITKNLGLGQQLENREGGKECNSILWWETAGPNDRLVLVKKKKNKIKIINNNAAFI